MPIQLDRMQEIPSTAHGLAQYGAAEHWLCLTVMFLLTFVTWALWHRTRWHAVERRRERRLREEIETYARLDATLPPGGDARPLAKRICRMVAEKSAFSKAALLLRDAEGRLFVAGSAGMDDLAVTALHAWGVQTVDRERSAQGAFGPGNPPPQRLGVKSFLLNLPRHADNIADPAHLATQDETCRRAVLVPLKASTGKLVGALAVCAGSDDWLPQRPPILEEAIPPLEALAVKLARTMENAALTERLVRVEKLAGLGQLAGGVAHELNNPLTAVLGFAELIAESAAEPRVREDAQTIVTEALRMREIIQNLVTFWRPVTPIDQPVDPLHLVHQTVAACRLRLEQRGISLIVSAADALPTLRGNPERLRTVLEHLLNNAAQAIQQAADSAPIPIDGLPRGDNEPPVIRITLSQAAQALHLVVSDTGPGFREPTRVFDPFYTTRQPGEGAGLGLSICYGIVREHGGEISAFNLHPHGAAVVLELPLREVVANETQRTVRETA